MHNRYDGPRRLGKGAALLCALLMLTLYAFAPEGSLFPAHAAKRTARRAIPKSKSELQKLIVTKKQKLSKLHRSLHDARTKLAKVNRKEREVAKQLRQTDENLKRANSTINVLTVRRRREETTLGSIRERLEVLRDQLSARLRIFSRRLRDIYMTQGDGYLIALLDSESFSDFLNKLEYLKKIIREDQILMKEIREKSRAFEEEKARRDAKIAELASIAASVQEKKKTFESLKEQRGELLDDIKGQRKELNHYVWELECISKQEEQDLHRYIVAQQGPRVSRGIYRGGAFGWPAAGGRIGSSFGWRVHPIRRRVIFHNGVDILVPYGTAIRAANDGVVILARRLGGYGNCVVIDHGGGVSSLYAHCSRLYVSYGAKVTRGQPIAACGSTGLSTGPHLHFEIRVNGTAVDPRGRL